MWRHNCIFQKRRPEPRCIDDAARTPGRIDIEDIAPHAAEAGVGLEGPPDTCQGMVGSEIVIGIEKAEIAASGQRDALVHGVVDAQVGRADDGGEAIAMPVDDLHRAVPRCPSTMMCSWSASFCARTERIVSSIVRAELKATVTTEIIGI